VLLVLQKLWIYCLLLLNFDIMSNGVLSGECSLHNILTIPMKRKSYLLFCYDCFISLE